MYEQEEIVVEPETEGEGFYVAGATRRSVR